MEEYVELAVCGLHMRGYSLNYQLLELGAGFVRDDKTKDCYRIKVHYDNIEKPFLMYSEHGKEIQVEVWRIPVDKLGRFMAGIPSPLSLGKIKLTKDEVIGFIGQAGYGDDYKDITSYGGWAGYISSRKE